MRLTLLLIFGFILIAAGGFWYLASLLYEDVERQYAQAAEEPMVDMAHLFAAIIEADLEEGKIDATRLGEAFASAYRREFRAKIYSLEKTQVSTHLYVTDSDGIVIFDSDGGKNVGLDFSGWRDVDSALRGEYSARATRADPDDSLSSTFYVPAPVYWEGEIIGVVSVSRPESVMGMFVEETREIVRKSGIWAAGIVVLLGAFWTYWLVRPITHLTDYARAVQRGDRVAKPKRLGVFETRTLGRALEEMRDALEGRRYVENYVQTLTHELKSPLAAILGAAELLDEDMPREKRARFLENIRNETGRSQDLVRRLLQLAAIESRKSLESTEVIDAVALIRDEIERIQPRCEPKQLLVEFDAENAPPVMLQGDRFALETALHNLLANAVDFSPEGGTIQVEFELKNDEVMISVADNGPGIPDYAQERVFERFYSLKHTVTGRKSSGLGLCFVKEAAELHGGSIKLSANEPNGTIARLTLALS